MDNEYIRILAANIGPIIANELAPMKQELRAIADSTHNLHLKLGALQTRFDEISERQETLGYQLLGLTKSQSELIHKKQKANGVVLENLVSSVNCLPTTISEHLKLNGDSSDETGAHNTSNNLLSIGAINVDGDLNHVSKTTQKISTLMKSCEENSGLPFSEKPHNFNKTLSPHFPPELIHQSAAEFDNEKTEHNNFTVLNPQAVSHSSNGSLNISQNKSVNHQLPSEINCPSEMAIDHQSTVCTDDEIVEANQRMVSLSPQNEMASSYRITVANNIFNNEKSFEATKNYEEPIVETEINGSFSLISESDNFSDNSRTFSLFEEGSAVAQNQTSQLPHTAIMVPTNILIETDDNAIQKELENKRKDELRRFFKNKFNYLYKKTNTNQNSNVQQIVQKSNINNIELEKKLEVILIPFDENDISLSELKKKGMPPDKIFKYYFNKLYKNNIQ